MPGKTFASRHDANLPVQLWFHPFFSRIIDLSVGAAHKLPPERVNADRIRSQLFSVQREAVDAANRRMTAERKESQGGAFAKIENQIREDLDIRREPLSAGQVGFTRDVRSAGAGKIGGHVGLGALAIIGPIGHR
jgi:hypothetical protein